MKPELQNVDELIVNGERYRVRDINLCFDKDVEHHTNYQREKSVTLRIEGDIDPIPPTDR